MKILNNNFRSLERDTYKERKEITSRKTIDAYIIDNQEKEEES